MPRMDSAEQRSRELTILKEIRDYNKFDCDSTKGLADWLRDRQQNSGFAIHPSEMRQMEIAKSLTANSLILRSSKKLSSNCRGNRFGSVK